MRAICMHELVNSSAWTINMLRWGTRGTVVEDVVGVERDVLRVTRVDSVLAVVE